ncbi:MAG: EAL domain-containing protein [Cycloclasticus sp.]|nr:EAL domain-containing protein [Cycloclasticus sp.]
MKLLIAEDDLTSRTMLTALAKKWGFDPVGVEDGEAAWEVMQSEQPPRLLLLDWEMPKLNGQALCQRIHQQEKKDPPFIIMLTSRSETQDVVAGLEAGANEYITKPFNNAELQARLQVGKRIVELENRRRLSEEKLSLAASVFEHAREGIIITDLEGSIIDVNDAFTLITEYEREEVIGKNTNLLSSGHHGKTFYRELWDKLGKSGHWYGEIWNRRKSGEVFAEMLTISTVNDEQGLTQNYIALFSDITQQKENEKHLLHLAHYDALTGLPNRVLLSDRLQQAMSQASRNVQPLAICYIDLDGFKAVNDTYGHEVGDKLLVNIAKHMEHAVREGDTIARLGGDEFVVVLTRLNDASSCKPVLTRLLEFIAKPVQINKIELEISASIGVSFYPQTEDIDADQLMRQADQAMYQAKLTGKNKYHIFDHKLDQDIRGQHESLSHIRTAMTNKEFVLFYQPQVNMRTGETTGVEALIRWQHKENGLLPPNVFLPVIEKDPLSIELGEWVIDSALNQLENWYAEGLPLKVSVNISALHLQQDNFSERLAKLLAAHPSINPNDLQLEVLETSTLEDIEKTSSMMRACSELGVDFALDDFGTGYSSLTYLKRLPATHLKIDKSFVIGMLNDSDDLSILKGVLGLASAFNREPIAEGVESEEHGNVLLQLGCEIAQGFTIAKPMPAADIPTWIDGWQPYESWTKQNMAVENSQK